MNLNEAKLIANNIVGQLKTYCPIIDIAGSVRRGKPEVKDIEIVALIPANMRASVKPVLERLCYILKGTIAGRYMQLQHKQSGVKIDLFMPMRHDYYRQLVIRTGSAEFTAKHIAGGWVAKGWVGTADGLRRRNECMQKGKTWVVCVSAPITLPPVWLSEQEFFQWLGLAWVEPERRNL